MVRSVGISRRTRRKENRATSCACRAVARNHRKQRLAGEEDALEVGIEAEVAKVCIERREDEAIAGPLACMKHYLKGQ